MGSRVAEGMRVEGLRLTRMPPLWMCTSWSIFLISSMATSFAGSNRRMTLRNSSKLFWNGVPDRMIRFLVRISAKAFQIAIFERLLLNFVPKSELSYLGLRSKKNWRASYCYAPITFGKWWSNGFLEIRKNMDHFLHIQNGIVLLDPLKFKIPELSRIITS